MQYILSEEEYKTLVNNKKSYNDDEKQKLRKFCTMVADNLPTTESWFDKTVEPRIWGCILTVEQDHVCDCCPSKSICPYEYKAWSK